MGRHTSAIKKTLKHNARTISVNRRPVGYSIPSPLLITRFSSSCTSLADLTLWRSSPSRDFGEAEDDDVECDFSMVLTGAPFGFSSRTGLDSLSVGAVDSAVVYFSSDMFANPVELTEPPSVVILEGESVCASLFYMPDGWNQEVEDGKLLL